MQHLAPHPSPPPPPMPSWWDQTVEDLSLGHDECPLDPQPPWLHWNRYKQKWCCRMCHKEFDEKHEFSQKHTKYLSYLVPNVRRPRPPPPQGCYLEQQHGPNFWTPSVAAPRAPNAGAGHPHVTTAPAPEGGGAVQVTFTLLENEITPFKRLLEGILGALSSASSSLSGPPGLGPPPPPGPPGWAPPPPPPPN